MTMAAFVNYPMWMIVVVGFLIAAFPPLLLWTIFYKTPMRRYFAHSSEVEAAVIGAVAILFGLFAAFLANDIWMRNQIGIQAVEREGDAIRTLARYTEGMPAAYNDQMRAALTDYAKTVIEKDWPKMTEGKRSTELLAKVRAISTMIVTGDIGKIAGPTIQGRMIDAFTTMRENRQIRVQLAEARTLSVKWYALMIFGLLTQLAIGFAHVHRPREQLIAQAIFGLALAACLNILIVNEFPFSAINPISPDPLQKAMESLYRS
jgi:hypothetical protein